MNTVSLYHDDHTTRTDLGFLMYATNPTEQFRASTLLTKEPETIAWIRSFTNHSLFYDVGANIGVYSLVARFLHESITIIPFEPQQTNIERLVVNMRLNGWKSPPLINPCAVGDIDSTVAFRPVTNIPGSADGILHPLPVDSFCTLIPIYRLDTLTHMFGTPNYIKIDVDGSEGDVIRGAHDTLNNKELKSVLIEINRNREYILRAMSDAGFTTDNDFNTMLPHSRTRREAEGIDCENIIFTRG